MLRAWVIGGKRGIGEVISQELQRREVEVVATDEQTTDVTSVYQLTQTFDGIKPNWVVYCAGVNKLMPAKDFDEWDAMNIMDINALGFMRVVQLVAAAKPVRKPASIVAIGSDAARIPMRNSMAYCASKAALHAAVRCAARELAPAIRVNAVAPGPVANTPMSDDMDKQIRAVKGWTEDEQYNLEEQSIPMQRRASAFEIAHVVCTTLDGPQYMTGSIIEINGGR